MIRFIIGLCIEGLIGGVALRAILPGEQDWSIGQTVAIGVVTWLVVGIARSSSSGGPRCTSAAAGPSPGDGLSSRRPSVGLIAFILFLLVWGAIVGGLGRLALPGPDPMTLGETILIGIVSSFLAGVLFRVILGVRAGILGSVLIATAAVYLVRRSRGGALGR